MGRFRGIPLLDGGLVDNVPAFVAEQQESVTKNIIFLTRTYPQAVTGIKDRRLYLAPSKPVPVGRWDYTQPHLLDETIAMGEREAALHEPILRQFLA